jgi:uncharacterized membrane protein YfcA
MKILKKCKDKIYLILSGLVVGTFNGFFGGGGGMMCVPILEEVMKVDNKKSHATALAVMLPIGLLSSLVYLLRVHMDWYMFGFVGGGFVVGGVLGALLLRKLSGKIVRIIFILVVLAAGVRMLI